MTEGNYSAAVYDTFCTNAIRSAILIDDQFPTYGQLGIAGFTPDAFHLSKAQILHNTFRNNSIICDIENNIDSLDPDRIRKSDLIVLDYFLNDNDPRMSIELLDKLSKSKHLNLVVLYTSEDLDEAWSRIAINLRGGWRGYEDLLDKDCIELWEDLDLNSIAEVDKTTLNQYVISGELSRTSRLSLIREFTQASSEVGKNFPKKDSQKFIDAWVHRTARSRVCCESLEKNLRGAFGENKWLLVGNVFIAFQKKCTGDNLDATDIMSCLHNALLEWKPNPIMLITSEIQNVLENEPLAFDIQLQEDLKTQAGWLFNFFREGDDIGGPAAIEQLLQRISGNLAEKILVETKVSEFAQEILEKQRGSFVADQYTLPKIAADLVGVPECDGVEIVHALNLDLSLETFSHPHITTGTIFTDKDDGSWWVCVSPACDMVPKQKNGSFAEKFDPNRPAKALRLEKVTLESAIKDAHQSRFIFVRDDKGKPLALSAYHGVTKQPDIWMFYIHNHRNHQGSILKSFCASVLQSQSVEPYRPVLVDREFHPLFQLRPPYAARLQAHSSHHTGRIGVDFVSWNDQAPTGEIVDVQGVSSKGESALEGVAEAV